MNRMALISIISIILTIVMIALFFIIPGFPLLIFLFLPPLFYWGLQDRNDESPSRIPPAERDSRFCPQCGKQLLEPSETYCPRCGTSLTNDNQHQ
jgi:hypothetical protein